MFMGVNLEEDNDCGSRDGDEDEEDMDWAEEENQVHATATALPAIGNTNNCSADDGEVLETKT